MSEGCPKEREVRVISLSVFLEITPSCARVKGGHAGHVGEIDRTAAAVISTNDSDTMPVMMLILTC